MRREEVDGSALREAEESGPGQPLGPLGSRRREGYLLRLSGGTGGYWNVVLRLPGSCTISCPKQPPRPACLVERCNAGPVPSGSRSTAGGSGFERALRPDGSPLPAGPVERPSGVPRLLFLRRTASADPSSPGIADWPSVLPDPHSDNRSTSGRSGSLNEPAPAGQTPDHRICDDRGRPQFQRVRIRTIPKSAEPLVDGSVAMASRLAAWDKGDLKKRQRAESR
jgi:hypothetical protein